MFNNYIALAYKAFEKSDFGAMRQALEDAENHIQEQDASREILLSRAWLKWIGKQCKGQELLDSAGIQIDRLLAHDALEGDDFLFLISEACEVSLELIDQGLQHTPDHFGLTKSLGDYYLQNQDYTNAISYYQKALLSIPDDTLTILKLQKCRYYRIQELENLFSEEESKAVFFELLPLYKQTHQPDKISKLITDMEGHAWLSDYEVSDFWAICNLQQNRRDKAVKIWEIQTKQKSINQESALILAKMYIHSGNPKKALDLLSLFEWEFGQAHVKPMDKVIPLDPQTVGQQAFTLNAGILRASAFVKIKSVEKANAILEDLLKTFPKEPRLWLLKAEIQSEAQNHEAVFHCFSQSKLNGGNPLQLEETKALHFFRIHDFQKAVGVLENIRKSSQPSAQGNYILGLAYEQLGEKEKAAMTLNNCVRQFVTTEDRLQALHSLLLIYLDMKSLDDAIRILRAMIAYFEEGSENHRKFSLMLAETYYHNKEATNASKLLVSLHKKEPLNRPYLSYLEMLFAHDFGKGFDIEMDPVSENSLVVDPKDSYKHFHNGMVYSLLKDNLGASKNYELAADGGLLAESYYKEALHKAYLESSFDDCIRIYKKLKTVNPAMFEDHYDAIYAYAIFMTEQNEQVIREYDRLLYTYPKLFSGKDLVKIWSNTLGIAYFKLGQFEKAKRYIGMNLSRMESLEEDSMIMLKDIAATASEDKKTEYYLSLDILQTWDYRMTDQEKSDYNRLKAELQASLFYAS
ncbi:tetratricopeptide (TPR) repeat protein [Algoriphagus sp. 4150]|uniref:tetratricopeptide repeat protein n=1 Tax=Algoriphagus sp. 4150 TaxID=2817756 RepID=UPI002866DFCC|nr:tetratricopeptide repeat protein [Algoriphagus sp. 4150]MDR7128825.1 tetratricopeptide (TPR) repeat protein [Algoriphagus sp. 4150]